VDLNHHTMEEIFQVRGVYEKKAPPQAASSTGKLVEQAGTHWRRRRRVFGLFAERLNHPAALCWSRSTGNGNRARSV